MRGSTFSRRGAPPRRAGLPGRGTAFFPKESGGKERPGGFARPGPPSTGVHGGSGLYKQGRDQTCFAARFPGGLVTGAAAPWAARIGVVLQALKVVALYQVRPPGRRRCHAAEIPGQSPQPSVGATCGRPPRAEGALRRRPKLRIVRFAASGKAHSLRWASSPHRTRSAGLRRGPLFAAGKLPVGQLRGVHPIGGSRSSPLIGRFKGWVQGGLGVKKRAGGTF